MTPAIPSAAAINYRDAAEICAYQALLCKMFELAGGFERPFVNSADIVAIQREGREWLLEVRLIIDRLLDSPIQPSGSDITLADVPRLLDAYDLFYRATFGRIPADYLRDIRLRAAARFARGDRSITQAQVALMIRAEAARDIITLDRRYLDYSTAVFDSWLDDLTLHGSLTGLTERDTYSVLAFLLRQDLSDFIPDSIAAKRRWIAANTLTDDQLQALPADTLTAYITFEQAAAPLQGHTYHQQTALHTRRLARLSTLPTIHHLLRQAISLSLTTSYKTAG